MLFYELKKSQITLALDFPRISSKVSIFFGTINKIKFEISKDKPFSLTGEQQKQLDDQVGLDKKHYTDAETVYGDLKNKYGL